MLLRRLLLSVTVLLMASMSMQAQAPFTEFKFGFLSPAGAKTGVFFGLNSGRMIDEALSYSFAMDVYHRSYIEESEIDADGLDGVDERIIAREIDFSSTYIPLLIKLNYEKNLESGFVLRAGAGIGYGFMWVNESNYVDQIEKTRFYTGLAWRLTGGAGMQISTSANLFAEVGYSGGSVGRDKGESNTGLPLRSEVDMNAFVFRIGVSIFNLGF
jgi:opacity protein-like surface antigen